MDGRGAGGNEVEYDFLKGTQFTYNDVSSKSDTISYPDELPIGSALPAKVKYLYVSLLTALSPAHLCSGLSSFSSPRSAVPSSGMLMSEFWEDPGRSNMAFITSFSDPMLKLMLSRILEGGKVSG